MAIILALITFFTWAIAGVSPVFFVLLTRIVFRDALDRQQKLGIASSLVGIAIIALSSL